MRKLSRRNGAVILVTLLTTGVVGAALSLLEPARPSDAVAAPPHDIEQDGAEHAASLSTRASDAYPVPR